MTIHTCNTWYNEPDANWSPGLCPYCGSENVSTLDSCLEDECYVYYCVCDDCECEFISLKKRYSNKKDKVAVTGSFRRNRG